MEYILGYDSSDLFNLKEYNTKEEADFESEEWCIVHANSLEEAKEKYEETFNEFKKNS